LSVDIAANVEFAATAAATAAVGSADAEYIIVVIVVVWDSGTDWSGSSD